jgi:8-oxo-dGTP pyrophosphatase MutT (NUDIX family)
MTLYNNPTPVAVVLIRCICDNNEIGLLAVRRGDNRGLALPGGYVDELENAESAASRELMEETGISLPPSAFKVVKTLTNHRNNLLIFCLVDFKVLLTATDIEGFVPNSEASELKFVRPGDELIFPMHQAVLNDISLW